MTFTIHTLGCKVNQYESSAISAVFIENGAVLVDENSACDVYCVNTCAVTEESVRKSKPMIRRARRKNPGAVIVVCGCAGHADTGFADSVPEADIIIGNRGKARVFDYVMRFLETRERIVDIADISKENVFEKMKSERIGTTRATLKIQDGCNNFCSYCIIPYARGRIRSKDIEEAVCEAEALAKGGCREIVLSGIHLDNYGKETGKFGLTDLLLRLDGIEGLERVRVGSLEPVFITEETVAKMSAVRNLCHHFHLSLQSGCGKTLRAMNRHYTPGEFAAAVGLLRKTFPDCSVTTDIIVGFPGETEEDFAESLRFAEKMRFARVHVFPFSERKGTRAAEMDGKLSKEVKDERCRRMIAACSVNEEKIREELVGKIKKVLFETEKDGIYTGYTPEYAEVCVRSDRDITNMILPVLITGVSRGHAEGRLA